MDLLWEMYQEWQIGQATGMAGNAGQQALSAEQHAQQLQQRLEKLTLITLAMWTLLREKTSLDETALNERVKELNQKLHLHDGHQLSQSHPCPRCGRMMSTRLGRCVFCGFVDEKNDVFGTVG